MRTYWYWCLIYWLTFIYGYCVFVVLREQVRVGRQTDTLRLFFEYYKQQIIFIVLILVIAISLVVYLLMKGKITL